MKAVAPLRSTIDLLLSFVSVAELEVVCVWKIRRVFLSARQIKKEKVSNQKVSMMLTCYIVVLQQMRSQGLPTEDVIQIIIVSHLIADHQVEAK